MDEQFQKLTSIIRSIPLPVNKITKEQSANHKTGNFFIDRDKIEVTKYFYVYECQGISQSIIWVLVLRIMTEENCIVIPYPLSKSNTLTIYPPESYFEQLSHEINPVNIVNAILVLSSVSEYIENGDIRKALTELEKPVNKRISSIVIQIVYGLAALKNQTLAQVSRSLEIKIDGSLPEKIGLKAISLLGSITPLVNQVADPTNELKDVTFRQGIFKSLSVFVEGLNEYQEVLNQDVNVLQLGGGVVFFNFPSRVIELVPSINKMFSDDLLSCFQTPIYPGVKTSHYSLNSNSQDLYPGVYSRKVNEVREEIGRGTYVHSGTLSMTRVGKGPYQDDIIISDVCSPSYESGRRVRGLMLVGMSALLNNFSSSRYRLMVKIEQDEASLTRLVTFYTALGFKVLRVSYSIGDMTYTFPLIEMVRDPGQYSIDDINPLVLEANLRKTLAIRSKIPHDITHPVNLRIAGSLYRYLRENLLQRKQESWAGLVGKYNDELDTWDLMLPCPTLMKTAEDIADLTVMPLYGFLVEFHTHPIPSIFEHHKELIPKIASQQFASIPSVADYTWTIHNIFYGYGESINIGIPKISLIVADEGIYTHTMAPVIQSSLAYYVQPHEGVVGIKSFGDRMKDLNNVYALMSICPSLITSTIQTNFDISREKIEEIETQILRNKFPNVLTVSQYLGVMNHLDFARLVQAFRNLSISNPDKTIQEYYASHYFYSPSYIEERFRYSGDIVLYLQGRTGTLQGLLTIVEASIDEFIRGFITLCAATGLPYQDPSSIRNSPFMEVEFSPYPDGPIYGSATSLLEPLHSDDSGFINLRYTNRPYVPKIQSLLNKIPAYPTSQWQTARTTFMDSHPDAFPVGETVGTYFGKFGSEFLPDFEASLENCGDPNAASSSSSLLSDDQINEYTRNGQIPTVSSS